MILMCGMGPGLLAQAETGFHQYLYPDGKVSSEGQLVDGKPDGHWKTFYETGVLKSEGDRKQFRLDGTWSFFSPDGDLVSTIEYANGLKDGPLRKYASDGSLVSEEYFRDDLKHGETTTYFPDGQVESVVMFKNGKEEGKGYVYAEGGRPITISDWRGGVLQRRQELNRYDKSGLRQGPWQGYFSGGGLKWEGRFVDDKRQGIFKEYDKQGNLKDLAKYDQDQVLPDAAEARLLDIKNTYHANGTIASIGSYSGDGVKDGLFRNFDETGQPTEASIYRDDLLV